MLSMLKLHLTRPTSVPTQQPRLSPRSPRRSDHENEARETVDRQFIDAVNATSLTENECDSRRLTAELHEMKDACATLHVELEKKDHMLGLLTEGLREVEVTQRAWVEENEILARDLETVLGENDQLRAEIARLQTEVARLTRTQGEVASENEQDEF
jgi:hypothetical protein